MTYCNICKYHMKNAKECEHCIEDDDFDIKYTHFIPWYKIEKETKEIKKIGEIGKND